MDRRLRNRFDVQVVFPDFAFGIVSRKDKTLTPEDVATSLEDFCRRIRNSGKLPESVDAVDPYEGRVEGRPRATKESSSVVGAPAPQEEQP